MRAKTSAANAHASNPRIAVFFIWASEQTGSIISRTTDKRDSFNGPEFTSRHFLAWCAERKIEAVHIEPGKPVQNAHVESFHGKLRDECLNASWFQNLFDARRKIAAWREEYNEERPHSSLGYVAPAAFARRMAEAQAMSSGGSNVV